MKYGKSTVKVRYSTAHLGAVPCRTAVLKKGTVRTVPYFYRAVIRGLISNSSNRCVSVSFWWMFIRSRLFSVFFSSSADSNWVCNSPTSFNSHFMFALCLRLLHKDHKSSRKGDDSQPSFVLSCAAGVFKLVTKKCQPETVRLPC